MDTPIHLASKKGRKNIVALLLNNGAATNVLDANNWTPLHAACFRGHEAVVELLLAHGAEIDAVDK